MTLGKYTMHHKGMQAETCSFVEKEHHFLSNRMTAMMLNLDEYNTIAALLKGFKNDFFHLNAFDFCRFNKLLALQTLLFA